MKLNGIRIKEKNYKNLKNKNMTIPKFFAVEREDSIEYRNYIKWLNKTYNTNWNGFYYNYYGYDGSDVNKGTNCFDSLFNFKNNPVIFTAKAFMDLLNNLSGNSIEKPKTFKIVGKPHQLESIFKDLEEIGYSLSSRSTKDFSKACYMHLQINASVVKKDKKINYVEFTNYADTNTDLIFNLPNDYSKALEYAKKAFNSNFWKMLPLKISGSNKDIDIIYLDSNTIEIEGIKISISRIKNLVQKYKETESIGADWIISVPVLNIGCVKNIPLSELEKIITFNE